MIVIIFCGAFGFAKQFFPGMDSLALFAGVPLLFELVTTGRVFDEREQQLLNQAFSTAFQWMAMVLFFTLAVYESLKWLNIGGSLMQFINFHWIGLVFSLILLLLGVTGWQKNKQK